ERRQVDESSAEVGLREDEQDRDEAEPEHAGGRPAGSDLAAAVGEEAREREDERELAELGGLEREEPERDPACRAAGSMAGEKDERDEQDRAAEDGLPVPAVDVGVDEDGEDERRSADCDVDDLPVEVVARVARDGEPRHTGDGPEPG